MSSDKTKCKSLKLELQTPSGGAIFGRDLGEAFLKENSLMDCANKQVVIEVEAQKSRAGNVFYSWDKNGVPLPDGFATRILIEGATLHQGIVKDSKNGNPMRQDEGEILVRELRYKVTALIVRTRRPFWLKVLAHKVPSRGKIKK